MKTLHTFFLLSLLLLAVSCSKSSDPASKKSQAPTPVLVEMAEAIQETVPLFLKETGTVAPVSTVKIVPQVSGNILKAHFKEGDYVKEGDLLFEIDPRVYKARLIKAESALAEASAQLKLNQKKLKRNKPLLEGKYIARQDFDALKEAVLSNEASVQSNKAAGKEASVYLEYCSVTAPISGRTGIIQTQVGNYVSQDSGTTLVEIKSMKPIYVDFNIPSKDLHRVRSAMKENKALKVIARHVTPASSHPDKPSPQSPIEGTLFFIDNAADTKTGTIKLRASFPNEALSLWPGEFVEVTLILEEIPDAITIPFSAIQIGARGPYVYVVGPGSKAELRQIELGQVQDAKAHISRGLSKGEKIITSGQLSLRPGSLVKPSAPTPTLSLSP